MNYDFPPQVQDPSTLQPVASIEPGVYASPHALAEGGPGEAEVTAELALGKSALVGAVRGVASATEYGIQATANEKALYDAGAYAYAAESAHRMVQESLLGGEGDDGDDGDDDASHNSNAGRTLVGAGRR